MRPLLPGWALVLIIAILVVAGMLWVREGPDESAQGPLERACQEIWNGFGLQVAPEPGPEGGLRVKTVQPGGPAELAGVRAGERVVACGDQSVWHSVQFLECISAALAEGPSFTLLIESDGRYRGVTVQAPGAGQRRGRGGR
jgi:S1-C subfamily serine protease